MEQLWSRQEETKDVQDDDLALIVGLVVTIPIVVLVASLCTLVIAAIL